MSILDIFIILSLGYNGFMGFRHGFIRQVLDLAALAVSTYLGFLYYPKIALALAHLSPSLASYSRFLGFLLIWVGIFVGVTIISYVLSRILSYSFFLGPLNRLLGVVVGFIKGVLVLFPFVLPMAYFNMAIYEQSRLAKPVAPLITSLIHHLHFK